jgi:pilus assembly protein CpaE
MAAASVILISPNEEHRGLLRRSLAAECATILQELDYYPAYQGLAAVRDLEYDAAIVDIDAYEREGLDLVESLCRLQPAATVMVFAAREDSDLLVRAMRAGAREMLTPPLPAGVLEDALQRAAARRAEIAGPETRTGKLLVFWGAKGGAGATTLACHFALALRGQCGEPAALLDLNPQLGGISVMLGLAPRFTLADALHNVERLDAEFVSTLFTECPPGLSVLASPDEFEPAPDIESATLARLLSIVRAQFPYVVADAGPGLGPSAGKLLEAADTIYVVAQAEVPSLRNAHRFLVHAQRAYPAAALEVALNRYEPRRSEFGEAQIAKALGVAPRWKIPNDYAGVRRALNSGVPLAPGKSPVARAMAEMARAACGQPALAAPRRRFSLFQ